MGNLAAGLGAASTEKKFSSGVKREKENWGRRGGFVAVRLWPQASNILFCSYFAPRVTRPSYVTVPLMIFQGR